MDEAMTLAEAEAFVAAARRQKWKDDFTESLSLIVTRYPTGVGSPISEQIILHPNGTWTLADG